MGASTSNFPLVLAGSRFLMPRLINSLLGGILLIAAALKGYNLATGPSVGIGLLGSRWFLVALVEGELILGLWLASGLWPRGAWKAAVSCFVVFAVVAACEALSGQASCGCFGRMHINPWYTASFDTAAVLLLLWIRSVIPESPLVHWSASSPLFGILAIIIGSWGGYAMLFYRPATVPANGIIPAQDGLLVLEPNRWIGKSFPLSRYIDIGEQLKHGHWLMVLYHDDCSTCAQAVSRYQRLARQWADNVNSPGLAFVEMPPYAQANERLVSSSPTYLLGRLSTKQNWFAATPVVVLMRGGIVQAAADGWQAAKPDPAWFTPN